ncbi:LytTR family transcriptional regulator DNA-binding domain-containing protein [Thioclava litoralis]|uniref:LytTR family transcriptional regulator DNA-binding domain-containing protein n=1 Tax=Thioclava litoralis TaxID=3076557 RepID=A0ABZ1E075_9RHOB|nr:LytTR family transcriptional regulator DNA-binding domain-containing protein [Thioclava sp. FTW29]
MWSTYLRSLSVPTLLLTWGAASVFGILGGPFGTFEWLTFGERLVYWPSLWAFGILIGCGFRLLYETVLGVRQFWRYVLLESVSVGLIMAFPYLALLSYFADIARANLPSLLELGAYNFAMTFFCVTLRRVFYPQEQEQEQADLPSSQGDLSPEDPPSVGGAPAQIRCQPVNVRPPQTGPSDILPAEHAPVPFAPAPRPQPAHRPRLLERLPEEYHGDIWHLQSRDHYVHVTTSQGSHQVLIRLADAITELDGVEGLQVHRSHWVAEDAVTEALKMTSKAKLTLRNGAVVPVSRTYLSDVEDAGLFDLPLPPAEPSPQMRVS